MPIILFLSVLNSYKSVPHECPYSYKSSLCVGVTVLPDLVTYSPAMPKVLPVTFIGGAVSSDPVPAAILSFCDVCVRLIGAGLVVC